ncbi:MAG: DUF3841 domain-containing protein [Proteobacteria bacterium]|nr:DUF3841 domain-containing protein [Pseudomonadota bacterium]
MRSIRLSMVLSEAAYGTLMRRGSISGDGRRIVCDCRTACRWMAEQMNQRLGPPPRPRSYPLWAWAARNGTALPRSFCQCFEPVSSGARGMLLEVELPTDKLLLSDLTLWQCVINGWYLCRSEADDLAFDAALSRAGVSWGWPYPEPFRSHVMRSWERIFDLDRETGWFGASPEQQPLQATFWRLEAGEVRGAQPFIAAEPAEPAPA